MNETTPLIPQPKKYPLRKIIPALWIGSFICAMDSTIVANIMNGIASEFNQVDQVSWVATSFLLTNTAFQPLYGKISDLLGRKHVLLFAQFWFALGCFLSFFAQSVFQFSITRAISGIGAGGISALSVIIVSDIVSLQERAMFQGYANIMYGVGQMIGGPLGGLFLQTIGWRYMFLCQVPCLIFCMYLTYQNVNIELEHVPEPHERYTKANLSRIDFAGSSLLVLTITGVLFLLSVEMTETTKLALEISTVLCVLGFFYVEKYVAVEQIVPPRIFRGVLGLSAVTVGLGIMVTYTGLFIVPIYVQVVQNYSPTSSGGFTAFSVISTSLGSYLTGLLLNRAKNSSDGYIVQKAGVYSLIGVVIQFVGITTIYGVVKITPHDSPDLSWKMLIVMGLTLVGFGIGSFLVSLMILVIGSVSKADQASTIGMNYLFRATGGVLGVAIDLAIYNKSLLNKLASYLIKSGEVPNGKEIFSSITSDSSYLRNSGLDQKIIGKVLYIYRLALTDSFMPGIIYSMFAVVLAIISIRMRKAI